MIPYNVSEPKLVLPEYGRNIQRMIDYCLTIEDREERNRCARSIADVMSVLFPTVAAEENSRRKIWDHIYIMSGFKLDVDFPCEVVSPEDLKTERKAVPYMSQINRYRHYGRSVQALIDTVAAMENSVEKDQLIFLIANQMKKLLVMNNPESATDSKVFEDIATMSDGKIIIDPETYKLNDYLGNVPAQTKTKKKKK